MLMESGGILMLKNNITMLNEFEGVIATMKIHGLEHPF